MEEEGDFHTDAFHTASNQDDKKEESSDGSKNKEKNKAKTAKQIRNKRAHGISVVLRQEKVPFEEIFSQEATLNLIVLHGGSGDQSDQLLVEKIATTNGGGIAEIDIIPGTSFGLLKMESVEASHKLMLNSEEQMGLYSIDLGSKRARQMFFLFSKWEKSQFQSLKNLDIPNAKTQGYEVPGLYIYPDFITEAQEQEILKQITDRPWQILNKRRVQHYGFEFNYGTRAANPEPIEEFPSFLDSVNAKMKDILKTKFSFQNGEAALKSDPAQPNYLQQVGFFDQLTINEYSSGAGIPPHIDTPSAFEEILAAISLESGITFSVKNTLNGKEEHLWVPPRSLLIYSGQFRYLWTHAIASRKVDKVEGNLKFRKKRVSLTFRKVRKLPLPAKYASTPSQAAVTPVNTEGDKNELQQKHVYEVYDKIAPHFSNTRYKPWPRVKEYLQGLEKGCGNGKYLGVNAGQICSVGTDRSEKLLEICRSMKFQVFTANSLYLPLRSGICDSVISIAVIHHFSSVEMRIQALNELARLLRTGGTMLVYVWAYEQEGKKFQAQDVFVPWHLQNKYKDGEGDLKGDETKGEETKEESKEVMESELKKAKVYNRYYHVFKKGELEELVKKVESVSIVKSYYDRDNWCVICEKKG